MTAFILVDGADALAFGPIAWSAQRFGRRLHELLEESGGALGAAALGQDAPTAPLSWAGCPYRILPCAVIGADHDPMTQSLGVPAVTVHGDAATAVYAPVDQPLEPVRAATLAALAAKRWEAECGGIRVAGMAVATDDRSKLLLDGARRRAERNPDATHRWKGPDGAVELTSAQIIALADAASDHVQTCFDHELDLMERIKAAQSVAELRAIDLSTGW